MEIIIDIVLIAAIATSWAFAALFIIEKLRETRSALWLSVWVAWVTFFSSIPFIFFGGGA